MMIVTTVEIAEQICGRAIQNDRSLVVLESEVKKMAKLSMDPSYSNGYDRGYQDALDDVLREMATLYVLSSTEIPIAKVMANVANNGALYKVSIKINALKEKQRNE